MAEKQVAKPVALAVGAALAGTFAVTGTANADTGVSPFAMTTLSAGYLLGAAGGGDKQLVRYSVLGIRFSVGGWLTPTPPSRISS